ncbi:MAG: polysaccharide biosynthesis protein [Aphanocapsa sp. GSE-SYN-MK-11-07L]|jgi:FlaA1/EpsC-like NDP-sugar epimerase|nr:polysaccharide biosynthesis protein [Aphanocapsa sp. GSE-SYN-MK-11-07L]
MKNLDSFALEKISRNAKKAILGTLDALLFCLSINISLLLHFESFTYLFDPYTYLEVALIICVKLIIFYAIGMYHNISRYTGLKSFSLAVKATIFSTAAALVVDFLFGFKQLTHAVIITDGSLTFLLVVGSRLAAGRLIFRLNSLNFKNVPERIIIYGAGAGGSSFANALEYNRQYRVVAFVDDDSELQRHMINGIKIYNPKHFQSLIDRYQVRTVLLAMPSVSRQIRRDVIAGLKHLPINIKTLPNLDDVVSGKVSISEIRDVDITDLLGREEISPDPRLLEINIKGKSVLVTGAGGSIGSELCRQIIRHQPKCLILYELNEFALYKIQIELSEANREVDLAACLGSVTDQNRFHEIIDRYQVETIYHAAAYKHVPLVEINPEMGIMNNVLGTLVAAQTAIAADVETFVLISTDKAVRPTNVMGASKRIAELVLQALANEPATKTRLIMVRFGNVLDSTGSVIPRFRQQIAHGKALTVTHPDITRYFMSIPEAARLVIQAGSLGQGGEVFLLDMGEPIKIYDLAIQMIELSGMVPGKDIEICFTGLRPGEKLYEELLIDASNTWVTAHPKIYGSYEDRIPWPKLLPQIDQLLNACYGRDRVQVHQLLKQIVTNYQPSQRPSAAIIAAKPVLSGFSGEHEQNG